MPMKNVNKNETKHKAIYKRTQHNIKEMCIQTFALIITHHVQMSRKNVRESCFIQLIPFC